MKDKSFFIKKISPVFFLGFVLLIFFTIREKVDFRAINFDKVNFFYLLSAFTIYVIYHISYGLLWSFILNSRTSTNIKTKTNLFIWLTSIGGKYLPLKFAGMGYKAIVYLKRVKKSDFLQALYDENILCLISGFTIALALVGDSEVDLFKENYRLLFTFGLLTSFFFTLPKVQDSLIGFLSSLMKRKLPYKKMEIKLLIKILFAYMVLWVFFGFFNFLIVKSMQQNYPLSSAPFLIWLSVASGMSGMFAFFAPSGLGAREAVFVFGLSNQLKLEEAIAMAILSRLVITVVEVTGILVSLPSRKKNEAF